MSSKPFMKKVSEQTMALQLKELTRQYEQLYAENQQLRTALANQAQLLKDCEKLIGEQEQLIQKARNGQKGLGNMVVLPSGIALPR